MGEYFPSAVHRQTRLGAILSPLVRALEIATDKSSIRFLQPSDPDSGHSSMTSAVNSVFTSPHKKAKFLSDSFSPRKKITKCFRERSSSFSKNPSMPELNLL